MNNVMNTSPHRYPIGIQTFEEIRDKGYLYIDKTELVYRMVHADAKYMFLGRPRRFGKSLLVSTLKCYFEGRKDLFKGLAIEQLEQEWTTYPVLHFSMAGGKHMDKDALEEYLDFILTGQEAAYGLNNSGKTANIRLMSLIKAAYAQTHRQVVLLIDEYDAPLLDVVHRKQNLQELRQVMRNFYSPIKDADPYLHFVFLTGITKFSQMSIFSELNNINNISMLPEFGGLCGITKEELTGQMRLDVEHLGQRLGMSYEETLEALRDNYDGYHFSWPSPDVFNPFSLLSALANGNLDAYWFASGTPTYLIEMMRMKKIAPDQLHGLRCRKTDFDAPTEGMTTLIPLLYQSGYLTIKDCNLRLGLYTLDVPNREIRMGLFNNLLPHYLSGEDAQRGGVAIVDMADLLLHDDMDGALHLLQDFLASIPYCNQAEHEGHYQQLLYVIFSLLTPYMADVEVHSQHGRIDLTVTTATRIFLLELKLNGSAQEALKQIHEKNYANRFALRPQPVTLVGANFDSTVGNLTDWVIE